MNANEMAMAKATELGENSWWESYKIVKNDWVKGRKNRTYYEMHGYSNGKFQKAYKVGYVDNNTDEFICQC